VHFTTTDPSAILPPDYTFTAADQGTHTFTITYKLTVRLRESRVIGKGVAE
jgi:hypothetical protein